MHKQICKKSKKIKGGIYEKRELYHDTGSCRNSECEQYDYPEFPAQKPLFQRKTLWETATD